MSYGISINRRAQKEIDRLPTETQSRVRNSIMELADEPRPVGCRRLRGREGWRIRVGDHRVIYEVNDELQTVTILTAAHRRDVYR